MHLYLYLLYLSMVKPYFDFNLMQISNMTKIIRTSDFLKSQYFCFSLTLQAICSEMEYLATIVEESYSVKAEIFLGLIACTLLET